MTMQSDYLTLPGPRPPVALKPRGRNVLLAVSPKDAQAYQDHFSGVDDALILILGEDSGQLEEGFILDGVHATALVFAHPAFLLTATTAMAHPNRGVRPHSERLQLSITNGPAK